MKVSRWLKGTVGIAAAAAVLALGACASEGGSSGGDSSRDPWVAAGGNYTREYRGEARPAPAPAARAEEKPAPAPAPRATGDCRPPAAAGKTVVTQAFPTGDLASSALVVHTVMPAEVRAGADFTYEYHVCNLTNGTLQNVVVSNENFNNFSVVSSTPAASRGADGSPQWVLGNLGAKQTQVISVTGRAQNVGVSSNCVTVSYNNFLCAETKVVQPALALTKTVTPEVLVCDTITYKLVVTNTGTGSCDNVVVKDTLPEGITTTDGKRAVESNVGTLAAGQSKEITFTAKASKTGRFENTATASSACGADAKASAAVVVRQPKLAIKAECSGRAFVGRDVTFRFTVSNTGDAACKNTVVTAPIPAGATFVRADNGGAVSGGNVVWNLGEVASGGGSKTLSMTVTPGGIGTVKGAATATCACSDPATDACETKIEGIPAILLEVVDTDDPIEVGQQVTYVITVTNQGSATGTGIKIVCELPGEEEFVSAGGATSGTVSGRTITFAPLPSLPPKAKAEFRIVVKATGAGDVRFKTSMTSDQFSRPVEETESTNLYQ